MNTSDIVEYNVDPSVPPQSQVPYADTLERDISPFVERQKVHTSNADQIIHNFHSFNPEASKTEAGETNADTTHPFSYEKRNLFSIEDLNSQKNMPLREIQVETQSLKENSGSRKRGKVRPSDLPMTTFKAQKHKKLIEEREKYNVNLISADSPMRNLDESQRRHSRKSSKKNKFLTEDANRIKLQNFNFYDLWLDHKTQITLPMLDLVWRREDGTRKINEDIISNEEIADQIIPLKIQPNKSPVLNRDLAEPFKRKKGK